MKSGHNRPSPVLIFTSKLLKNEQLVMSMIACVVGLLVGGAAIAFLNLINFFQTIFIGIGGERISTYIATLPAWRVILTPSLGGLLIGLLLYKFMSDQRPKGPADVIAACEGQGAKMSAKDGILGVITSALSIGAGASVGREGPAVHMGASLSVWLGGFLRLSQSNMRILLGCGVASAISASFNAPIAGALFAQEVILSHYALKAFAPVVIASVAGAVVSHQVLGNLTVFALPSFTFGSYAEFPAFGILAVLCGFLGILFVRLILDLQKILKKTALPEWLKPAIGGAFVGGIALFFPQVMGVGYEATDLALKGQYAMALLAGLFFAKFAATVLSQGFGFAGGVFSPSLVIGAMFGGLFGFMVEPVYQGAFSGVSAYSLVGMATMGAGVLGAPISTTLIVFELTGNYSMTIVVMFGCVLATLVNDQCHKQSFFLEQLKRRGIDLFNNYSQIVLNKMQVKDHVRRAGVYVSVDTKLSRVRHLLMKSPSGVIFVVAHNRTLYGTIYWEELPVDILSGEFDEWFLACDLANSKPPVLQTTDPLDIAQRIFDESQVSQIAVVDPAQDRAFVGCLDEREIMLAYNHALLERRREEQGVH